MKKVFVLLFVMSLFGWTACQKAPYITYEGQREYLFTRMGGSETLTFSANREWLVSTTEPWCQVTPTNGSAGQEGVRVTIECEPNSTYDDRKCKITIHVDNLTETVSILQEAALGLQAQREEYSLSREAQLFDVEIKANIEFDVSVDPEWINLVDTKGLKTNVLSFNAAENETYASRSGKIRIDQKDGALQTVIIIIQAGRIAVSSIQLDESELELKVSQNSKLHARVLPENATDKHVEWTSSDPSIASVNEQGEVSALSSGTVIVTASAGGKTASCKIVVTPTKDGGHEGTTINPWE